MNNLKKILNIILQSIIYIDCQSITNYNFPINYNIEQFQIQYKNSIDVPIIVWLSDQPICLYGDTECKQGNNRCMDNIMYPCTTSSWKRSVGFYQILDKNNKTIYDTEIPKALTFRNQKLNVNETWRIFLPQDNKYLPYWCFTQNNNFVCPGVNSWITLDNIYMNAPEGVSLFEFNINAPSLPNTLDYKIIFFDVSAVDGLNTNHRMFYSTYPYNNISSNNYVDCKAPLQYCPQEAINNRLSTCQSPKWWSTNSLDILNNSIRSKILFNNNPNSYDYCFKNPYNLGKNLAGCGYGNHIKACCHMWWSTSKVAEKWINFIYGLKNGKQNDSYICQSYAWAYDEMKWYPYYGFDNYNLMNYNPVYKTRNKTCNNSLYPDNRGNCIATNNMITPLRTSEINYNKYKTLGSLNIEIIDIYK